MWSGRVGVPLQSRSRLLCVTTTASARDRQDGRKTRARHVAPAVTEQLDNAERARLEETDAFKELVALNAKQSRNRPQKVSTFTQITF